MGPNLCRPTIPSSTPSLGTHRLAQNGHTLYTTTCSVTCAGLNTTSITSRRRLTVPPCRTHSQLGHRTIACIICLSAILRLRANPLGRFLRGRFGPFRSGLLGLSQDGGFGPGRSFRASSRSTSNCSTPYRSRAFSSACCRMISIKSIREGILFVTEKPSAQADPDRIKTLERRQHIRAQPSPNNRPPNSEELRFTKIFDSVALLR